MTSAPAPAARLEPLEAVRLLRQDVLGEFTGHAPDADDRGRFLLWWALAGHRSYPAAADVPMPESRRRWLFEPLPGQPPHASGLGLNRLLHCLYTARPDLQRVFDLACPIGRWDAIAWFYLVGMRELGLARFVDDRTRAALNAPAFDSPGEPGPSWLMVLLWQQQAVLQQRFDLEKREGRAGLVLWFARQGAAMFKLQDLLAAPVPAPLPEPAMVNGKTAPFGINLIGFAYGELGIGEDLRMAVEACQAAAIPFKVLNINPGSGLRQADRWVAAHVVDDIAALPHAVNLFCLTGFDTLRVYAERGPQLFDGRHNIGWWPWELPVWPARWARAFDVVDEVWAATRFTQKMFEASTDKPVTLMPLPVSIARVRKTSRKELGLPARRFLFLFIFDFNSYLARKNPMAVIDAFQKAFPAGDSQVGLVLKTMNSKADNAVWDAFVKRCEADSRIVLMQRTLDREVVLGLVDSCDAYVSLHRSEGFGRTLAEAMLFGKPVVGTGFSGNADFLTEETGYPVKWARRNVVEGEYPFVKDADAAWWADADVGHAARQMRAAREAAGSEWALQLPQQVAPMFSVECIGVRMAAAVRARLGLDAAVKRGRRKAV